MSEKVDFIAVAIAQILLNTEEILGYSMNILQKKGGGGVISHDYRMRKGFLNIYIQMLISKLD